MAKYEIFTDATSDLPPEVIDSIGIKVIPMDFEMDGKLYSHYPDERELDSESFYKMAEEGVMITTTQITLARFTEYFTSILKEGKVILYFCFPSRLSGTYGSS